MKKFLSLLVLCVAFSGTAQAHSYKQGDIAIGHCWARATTPNAKAGAVYLPLLNNGKEADKLIGVSTDVAADAGLHETVKEDGITKMKMLDAITLEPGKPVTLRPGSMHIMLMGLKKQLKQGESFPLTLQFEKAGEAHITVMIEDAGASEAGH